MSQAVREALSKDPHVMFQRDSQRTDLLDETKFHTNAVANMQHLVDCGHYLEITAMCSDHHDDTYLNPPSGEHTHAGHDAFDFWFNSGPVMGEKGWLDANDPRFAAGLRDLAKAPYLWQIGLAGSADTPANRAAAGPTVFNDDGGDHVHAGAI